MARAVIIIDRLGDAVLRTPFNAAFVDALKEQIPASARQWRPESKTWWIDIGWVDEAIDLCREFYGELEITDEREAKKPPPPPPPPPPPSGPYAVLHLLPTAPWPIVDVVYRKLAAMHHPDVGGDVTLMQRINAAYDKLRKMRNV